MFKTKTRFLSFILVLCLAVSLFAGLNVSVLAVSIKNTGTRHELCTELSAQALAYYSGEYDWDSLSELDGVATDSSLAAMDSELYEELQELMEDTMTDSVTYKSLTDYWKSTDTEDGASNAVLFYSDTVGSGYNREHVWPKSRGSFYQKNAGSDLHHLRPTYSDINSTRSNYTMGDVVGVLASYSTKDYNGKAVLYYNAGSDLVEVNDNIKGDVARILLYVYVRWGQPNLCEDVSTANLPSFDSDDSENNGQAVIEDLDTLLQWCQEDPVDTWEMSRNDCIQNIQGNRNVFIDYPEYAWLLFGREVPSDMATPSHEAENTESYTVTAVSSNTAYGTVSLSGSTITAYPAKGYVAKSAEVTPAGSAKITRSGNSFVVSAVKADCTVKINFVKETLTAPAVLSFEAPCEVSDINTSLGKSVTLPDCSAEVTGYTFLGWVESPMSETTVTPDYYEAGSSYTVQSTSVILYALYSRSEKGGSVGDTAELVTTAPADWSGSYVIGVSAKETMMSSLSPGKTYLNCDTATFSGTAITNAKDENIFTLSKVGSYYAIQSSDGAYLKCGGAKNVSLDSSKSSVTASDTAYLWNVNVGSISPCTASCGKLQYNASSPRFTTYTSAQTAIGLYRIGEADTVYYVTLSGEADPDWVNPFVDVSENAVYYNAVLWAYYHKPKQITAGFTETEFRPNAGCTRAQVVTFLWRAAGEPQPESDECPFVDISDTSPFRTAIIWASEQNITKGLDATHFAPGANVTRAQFVTFLWRYRGSPEIKNAANPFTDVSESSVYYPAIIWAAETGVTNGYGNNDFRPGMTCTRWHVVLFLQRALENEV